MKAEASVDRPVHRAGGIRRRVRLGRPLQLDHPVGSCIGSHIRGRANQRPGEYQSQQNARTIPT
jgi:hypothetical protein